MLEKCTQLTSVDMGNTAVQGTTGFSSLRVADQSSPCAEHFLFLFLFFYAGVFTGAIIRLISDIRAKHGKDSVDLRGCGKFTLAEDLSDIKDITSIDMSNIYSLEGT